MGALEMSLVHLRYIATAVDLKDTEAMRRLHCAIRGANAGRLPAKYLTDPHADTKVTFRDPKTQ